MTFFELIRNSLLSDSAVKKPPGELVRSVLCAWREKSAQNHNNQNSSTVDRTLRNPE